jgi:hypothetical protein
MAKKQKSPRKRDGGAPAQPLAALYRLDTGTPRGDAVRAVLQDQGIRVRTVAPERLGDPVGAIAGLRGFHPLRTPYAGEAPESEFMLLSNVANAQLDALLAAMREAGCSVACKAQVTQHNRLWPFEMLVREVSREHALIAAAQEREEREREGQE